MIGIVYEVQPQPPEPADTTWHAAGAVTLGVEYRNVDPASLAATYGGDAAAMAEIEANSPEGGFSDCGVSIHVSGTDDGHEYLRFDVFDDDPHYHYVWPEGGHNNVVPFDRVAQGDMLDFAIGCLRARLDPMLREAHGASVADALDPDVQAPVIDRVEDLARRARTAQRSVRA